MVLVAVETGVLIYLAEGSFLYNWSYLMGKAQLFNLQ
jgi:hypothetical protein